VCWEERWRGSFRVLVHILCIIYLFALACQICEIKQNPTMPQQLKQNEKNKICHVQMCAQL
jgi:hypothetical protein